MSKDARGREVVGLYGDPDANWGIALEAGLLQDVATSQVESGLQSLADRYPHLGRPGPVVVSEAAGWEETRALALAKPFLPNEPLVRATLVPATGSELSRLLVGAHHGVCDGLGLLALLGAAIGTPVTPTATGLGSRSSGGSFVASLPRRIGEALRRPPPRFPAVAGADAGSGEAVVVRSVERAKAGTVAVCRAVALVFFERTGGEADSALPLVFVGASRRRPGHASPRTGRRRTSGSGSTRPGPLAEAARRFAALAPEPDFPETSLADSARGWSARYATGWGRPRW